jgi:hypothetical protein
MPDNHRVVGPSPRCRWLEPLVEAGGADNDQRRRPQLRCWLVAARCGGGLDREAGLSSRAPTEIRQCSDVSVIAICLCDLVSFAALPLLALCSVGCTRRINAAYW